MEIQKIKKLIILPYSRLMDIQFKFQTRSLNYILTTIINDRLNFITKSYNNFLKDFMTNK